MTWDNSTADADNGAGKIAWNHATIASATVLYVDDVDDAGANIQPYVDTWDVVTNTTAKGYVQITKEGTTSTYALFKVSGAVTDATGYSKIAVTHIVSNGSFSDGDGVGVQFVQSGSDGSGDMSDVVDDTTPQLGGDLDVNSNDLVSTSNGNIDIVPNGTGVARAKDGGGTTAALKIAGKESIWVPANAMTPTESNGCESITAVETTSGRPDMYVLDFDKDSDEHAQFTVAFPKSWNLGTITYQVFWSGLAATTGVTWSLQGVAMNDNETIDVAYGTPITVDDDAQSAVEELLVSAESSAVTIAGTPADDDLTYFRIFRDVSAGNDDMAGDARLHGVKLFYTTDSANDA
jgi:hypothetical protein